MVGDDGIRVGVPTLIVASGDATATVGTAAGWVTGGWVATGAVVAVAAGATVAWGSPPHAAARVTNVPNAAAAITCDITFRNINSGILRAGSPANEPGRMNIPAP
jgi:hypothetical protein